MGCHCCFGHHAAKGRLKAYARVVRSGLRNRTGAFLSVQLAMPASNQRPKPTIFQGIFSDSAA
jgi:hypothetical protein